MSKNCAISSLAVDFFQTIVFASTFAVWIPCLLIFRLMIHSCSYHERSWQNLNHFLSIWQFQAFEVWSNGKQIRDFFSGFLATFLFVGDISNQRLKVDLKKTRFFCLFSTMTNIDCAAQQSITKPKTFQLLIEKNYVLGNYVIKSAKKKFSKKEKPCYLEA